MAYVVNGVYSLTYSLWKWLYSLLFLLLSLSSMTRARSVLRTAVNSAMPKTAISSCLPALPWGTALTMTNSVTAPRITSPDFSTPSSTACRANATVSSVSCPQYSHWLCWWVAESRHADSSKKIEFFQF